MVRQNRIVISSGHSIQKSLSPQLSQVNIYCMCQILNHPSKKHLAYFLYQNTPQLIFSSKEGVMNEVLKKSFRLVDKMLGYYSKVTAVLIQLHQAQATADNKLLTIMIQRLKKALKSHYQCEVGYFWVREQNKADSQHYHVIILLNGHKCQQSKMVDILTEKVWKKIHPDNFSFKLRNRIYRIHRHTNKSELRALRMRMSYMAKREGKSNNPLNTHDYGLSRLSA